MGWTKSEQQAGKAVLHNYLNKRAFTLVEDWKDKEELDESVNLGAWLLDTVIVQVKFCLAAP